ncbi:diguanylate cyclase (GGDEF)-like protein [Acidovorax sp. 69]|uniref:GGDEF domain-containing protein n=1 Tax=Acidovorax sp. 69 TaxID=2035202 RepID=UPI000C243FC4|nr:GGDEF domain-containing protein [Acidovorax sp. 69]PJI96176.1 diguanylate cyclase (GGDEF)-like protein [Acidovorax sp. 69]
MQLSRMLHLLGALVLVATIALVGRMATTEWRSVHQASESLRLLDQLRLGLLAVEMVSRERGPTNGALGDALPLEAHRAQALQEARARTDQAFDALLQAVAFVPRPAVGSAGLAQSVQVARQALVKARSGVDEALAMPQSQRSATTIREAVYGMVAVVPLLAPVTNALASTAQHAYPVLSDDVQGARLAVDLREYAGLLGSHFTAALVKGEPFSPAERRAIDETRGRIAQLRALVELRLPLPGKSAAAVHAWGRVEARYFGVTQALLDTVLAQGDGDGHYGLSAAGFAALYVPEMNPILELRDALLVQAHEQASQEYQRALRVLIWALAGSGVLLVVLGGALYVIQYRVLQPLAKTTRALSALANDNLQAPLPELMADDEMAAVIGAVRSLQGQTMRRQELERERDRLIEQLKEQSETDYLTGLPNRRSFIAKARSVLAQAMRYDVDVALVVLDIDWFKQLNDTLGHAAGDKALLSVADVLRAQLREGDLVARFGGEEFVVLLRHCDREQGLQFAERLREMIAGAQVLGTADPAVAVTASLGIADSGRLGWGLDALLSAADAAMYQAKNAGRNRAVASSSA